MTVRLLTIDDVLPTGLGATPASSKSDPAKNTGAFATALADSSPSTEPTEAATKVPRLDKMPFGYKTDNNINSAQKAPTDKPLQPLQPPVGEKVATETPSTVQSSQKPEDKGPTFAVALQPNIVQQWLKLYSITVEHGKKGVATKVQPKAGYQLAKTLAELRTHIFPTGAGQTAKPASNKPLLTIEQSPTKLSPVPTGAFTPETDTEQAKGEKLHKMLKLTPELGKTIITTKSISKQEAGEQLMAEPLTAGSKNATASKEMVEAEGLGLSASQKMHPLTSKGLVPEAANAGHKTTAASEKPAIEAAPNTSGSQKVAVLHMVSVKAGLQSSDSADTTKSPLTGNGIPLDAGTPAESKANTGQQAHPAPLQLLVASGENGDKDSQPPANTPSGEVLAHMLNTAQVQIPTGRAKGRGSSSSNNSNFQQMFSHSNVQSPIAQQTSASAQPAAKTPGNPYPGNASAAINEQILQSIHTSLQQDQQQIIIRLKPPELGKVLIKFQQQQDQITGLLQVDKPETRAQIQQALPQIVQNLHDSGIQIKRLEVILTDQQQQAYRDQSLQSGPSHQQQAFYEANTPDGKAANEWLTNDSSYPGLPQPQHIFITDNSINILI